jgi:two-component system sensor histidine kinase UhpB
MLAPGMARAIRLRRPRPARARLRAGGDVRLPSLPLLARVLIVNTVVLSVAVGLLWLHPVTRDEVRRGALLAVGLVVVLVVNAVLLHRVLAPLRQLRESMQRVDPLAAPERVAVASLDRDVRELAQGFNEMAERLHAERRDAARWTLAGQETERRRVAHELHDDVGQQLTALLIQLDRAERLPLLDARREVGEAREAAREALGAVRDVVRELRPDILDDLGLEAALASLCARLQHQTGTEVTLRVAAGLPRQVADVELAIYRVAQEGLTNALRHGHASHVAVSLELDARHLVLRVRDDGRGLPAPLPRPAGLQGLRERALAVGGAVVLRSPPGGGTELELRVPSQPAEP